MNINVKVLEQNRSHEKLSPIGICIHSTADQGATAENEYQYFNSGYHGASAHAFIDWNEVLQTISIYEKAWGAGQTANSKYIHLELCEPDGQDEDKFNEVWKQAVEYCVYLFRFYLKVNVSRETLTCHDIVSQLYHETNHNDPIPYFSRYGKTWDDFYNDVDYALNPDKPKNIDKDMIIKIQSILNEYGFTDQNGKALDTDGMIGTCTRSAFRKLYDIIMV
jgi:N-acetylmuramoyl-L-alanine amidase